MKIKDLIKYLQQFDENLPVIINMSDYFSFINIIRPGYYYIEPTHDDILPIINEDSINNGEYFDEMTAAEYKAISCIFINTI